MKTAKILSQENFLPYGSHYFTINSFRPSLSFTSHMASLIVGGRMGTVDTLMWARSGLPQLLTVGL